MKINKITIIKILLLSFLFACSEDRLIEKPVDQFEIQYAINSESDMKAVVNGIYDQYSASSGFGADILAFGDLISDNVFITAVPGDVAYQTTGYLNWSSDISNFGMLNPLYDGIILSNTVINNTSIPETVEVLNLKGEARIARAVGLYYAVSFYSPNPTSGMNQEYGVPVNLNLYDPFVKLSRASVAEVYNQIITDLTTALSIMTKESPTNKGHLSPTAARLLLSRVYLTRGQAGDYQKAIDYADMVINSANTGIGFDFVDTSSAANFTRYFYGAVADSENKPETVWEINMNQNDNLGVNNSLSSFYAYNGQKKRFLFTQNFYSSFETTDLRRGLFISVAVPSDDSPRGIWTRKYVPTIAGDGEGPFAQNVKIFRMSEAKLNKIEALYKMGSNSEALIELNQFSLSRKSKVYTSASLENILDERRKEFFGEGQRFFDLKRNNLGFEKPSNCYSIVCSVPANDKLFVIPMPLNEMTGNPNMKQYPGW